MKFAVGAHTVDLGGRWPNDPLLLINAFAHDGEVRFKVNLKHPQRVEDVGPRRRDACKRNDDIGTGDQFICKLCIKDIALVKFETRIAVMLAEHIVTQVIGYHAPVLFSVEDAAHEVLTDKAVGAKYE